MSMLVAMILAQAAPGPWDKYRPAAPPAERLGPGPHTLVITDRNSITRMAYRTGPDCLRARNEIRRQTAPPPDTQSRIYGPSTVKAFCVPR